MRGGDKNISDTHRATCGFESVTCSIIAETGKFEAHGLHKDIVYEMDKTGDERVRMDLMP